MSKKVAIVGGGAVGACLAVRLGRRHDVHVLYRSAAKARAAAAVGLEVVGTDSVCERATSRVHYHGDAAEIGPSDVVFLCTKRTVPSCEALAPLLTRQTVVVPLLNGVEHLPGFCETYARVARPLVGCIRVLADMPRPGRVELGHVSPAIVCGPPSEAARLLQEEVAGDAVDVHVVQDISREMWRKFVFIVASSAVCAACRAPLQEVERYPESAQLLDTLVREVCAVASRHGHTFEEGEVRRGVCAVSTGGGDASLSLQRDIQRGRPSELDEQLGAMLRAARQEAVDTPSLRTLHAALVPVQRLAEEREEGDGHGDRCTGAEWAARCDLAACHRLLALRGMSDGFVTHVSLRIPGEEAFLLTPFGLLFSEVTASSLLKIPLSPSSSPSSPSVHSNATAVSIHAPLQAAGHAAVVHTHTAAGNAVSVDRRGLLPWTQKAMLVLPFVRYHDFAALAMDCEEGEDMAASLSRDDDEGKGTEEAARVLILRHHGLLTVGETIGEAFLWMEWTEAACEYQTRLLPLSDALRATPDAQAVDRTMEQAKHVFGRGGTMHFSKPCYWTALLTHLETATTATTAISDWRT